MREACIRAVANALGREPNAAELRNIEVRVQGAMLQGARENPEAWRAMTNEQRLADAGRRAAESLQAEAQKQVQRAEATIVTHDRLANYRATQVAKGHDPNGVYALERTLIHKYDEKSDGFRSVEETANATADFALSQIEDIFDTVNPGLWRRVQRGIWNIEALRRGFTEALAGKTEGVPRELVGAAERYHEIGNALREQFNAAGGVVGKLEDYDFPHTWAPRLIEKYGREQFVEDMANWADPRRYVHDDGTYYTRDELRAFFHEASATVLSDGVTQTPDGLPFPGGAVKANRGSQHRVIHLKPEHVYDAVRKYSDHNVLEAMIGGIRRMSRDVALVETFGPNSDYQFRLQLDKGLKEAAQIDPRLGRTLQGKARYLQSLYDTIAGNNPTPANRPLADAMQTARNLQVASKLGSAVITSISDYATMYQAAFLHRLNPLKVMLNSSLAWSKSGRRYARRLGLVMETVLADMERYSTENLTSRTLSAKAASAVIRASGLTFVTNARRLGFSMTLMDSIGHLTRQYADVSRLAEGDRQILARKGITQETWDIWRASRLDTFRGNTLLTPDNIMLTEGYSAEAKREAVIDLLAIVRSEQDIAIITPGARERAAMMMGTSTGTISGEMVRSVMLFKAFPWAFMQRHFERGWDMTGRPVDRASYLASLIVFMTMGGVAAQWINDIINGKDPRTMDVTNPETRSVAVRNWMQAFMKGGGGGVYGDFLFAQTNAYTGNSMAETILGANVGTASELQRLTTGNLVEAMQGEETHAGSEAVRFARGITPGANLWITKGITDRYIFNQLSDMVDPGATERMRDRQMRQQQSSWWWDPTEPTPTRAPDLAARH